MMKSSIRKDEEQPHTAERLRWSVKVGEWATALVIGLEVLIPACLATNRSLAGWQFLATVGLASCAIVLIREGLRRIDAGERWHSISWAGVGLAFASLLLVLPSVSHAPTAGRVAAERANLVPTVNLRIEIGYATPTSRGPGLYIAYSQGDEELAELNALIRSFGNSSGNTYSLDLDGPGESAENHSIAGRHEPRLR